MKIFTLIEMLIVIAIIAVLAAMLFPALNKAKEKAQSIGCLNNLKQQGIAFATYLGDNKEYFPTKNGNVAVNMAQNSANQRWNMIFVSSNLLTAKSFNDNSLNSMEMPQVKTVTMADGTKKLMPTGYSGYGYNYHYLSGNPTVATDKWFKSAKITELKTPSTCYVTMDTRHFNYTNAGYYEVISSKSAGMAAGGYFPDAMRHNGNVNILYADFHALGVLCSKRNPYLELGDNDTSKHNVTAWTGGRFPEVK